MIVASMTLLSASSVVTSSTCCVSLTVAATPLLMRRRTGAGSAVRRFIRWKVPLLHGVQVIDCSAGVSFESDSMMGYRLPFGAFWRMMSARVGLVTGFAAAASISGLWSLS
jgi:hypothetical protein